MAVPTRSEVEELLQEDKVIRMNLEWKAEGSGYKLEAAVLALQTGRLLRLMGNIGIRNYSFALLFNNYPIRKYTVHAAHKNPSGELIRGPHKHLWDEVYNDRSAYVPTDIRADNINEEMLGFLVECNVALSGHVGQQPFLFQGG